MVTAPTSMYVKASQPEDFAGSRLLEFEEQLTHFLARRLRKARDGLKMSSQQHWPEFRAQKVNKVAP